MSLNSDLQHIQKLLVQKKWVECKALCIKLLGSHSSQSMLFQILSFIQFHEQAYDKALININKAISLNGNVADYYNLQASILLKLEDYVKAKKSYEKALELQPNNPQYIYNYGCALMHEGNKEEAVVYFKKTIVLEPNNLPAYLNLIHVLIDSNNFSQAQQEINNLLETQNVNSYALYKIALHYREMQLSDKANEYYQKALTFEPAKPEYHRDYGISLLTQGNYLLGWPEYYYRHQCQEQPIYQKNLDIPLWQGEDLTGKTILLYGEQGFGDTIQYVRYCLLPEFKNAKIILEVQQNLITLLQDFPVSEVISRQQSPVVCDYYASLMDIPYILKHDKKDIPSLNKYISVTDDEINLWREKFNLYQDKLKIGIAWRASDAFIKNKYRSFAVTEFILLLDLPNIQWFSLQVDHHHHDLRQNNLTEIIDLSPDIKDFRDTAAIISALDLVISVDTSIVHLAGALGQPVWVPIGFIASWTWGLQDTTTPWYPSMRLFRQSTLWDWPGIFQQIRQALSKMAD